ncbi:MAG: hypothetical protein O2856_15260 [Planctomycetota bacterium]|nr:hypothetical protein [Planctomycetota bacterium]
MALQLSWEPNKFYSDKDPISASRYIMDGDLDKLAEMIDAGLDVNATGDQNMTLLFWALICNKLEEFELLLAHGASPDVPLKSSVDVGMNGKLWKGDTVLFSAAERRRVPFLEKGIPYSKDLGRIGAGGFTLMSLVVYACPVDSLLNALIEADADIDSTDDAGNNQVTRLIIGYDYACAQLLLDAGADPRFGPKGIEGFWRAFDAQRSSGKLTVSGQQKLERIRQTVLQRLADDPY